MTRVRRAIDGALWQTMIVALPFTGFLLVNFAFKAGRSLVDLAPVHFFTP